MSEAPAAGGFSGLIETIVRAELDRNPVAASSLGSTEHDARLPDLSAEAIRAAESRDDEYAESLRSFADADLPDPEDRADRDLAMAILSGRRIMRDWQDWKRSPDAYTSAGLDGVNALFLHRLRPEAELVEAAASRLRAVPGLLDQGRANLDPELAYPPLIRRGVAMARAGATFCTETVPELPGEPAHRETLRQAAGAAADALTSWADHLEGLAERATGDFAIGEERYDALLREREGLPWTTRLLQQRGVKALETIDGEMRALAHEIAGEKEWHSLVERLRQDTPADPQAMREEYAEATARARQFLVEHDLVTLPDGERCEVDPAPAFARPMLAVAFYFAPPPLASPQPPGHFFVPTPPDGATPEQITARLQTNSRFSIPTIAVHEAYPGHHWHLAHLGATQQRLIRSVFRTPYFVEGWALYAEQFMADAGFFSDPVHRLGQLEARIFRAARIIVDTGLHLGELSPEEAVAYLTTHTALTEDTARAEVTRYCAWPTQAPSYLTGALEVERMAKDWVAGGGNLREFHDRIAGAGGLPLAVAERLLHGR